MYEELLYRSENDSLDFKSEQYKFENEKDKDLKSEILKDIIAFANAWRTEDAFILIGVKENKVKPHDVVGTDLHLDDASLQQFVNSKTNIPIKFSYSSEYCNGLQIGVIKITHKTRPVFLKKPFGKLASDKVYIRHGSSTDIADTTEITNMAIFGVNQQKSPKFDVEFYDTEDGKSIGMEKIIKFKFDNSIPQNSNLPDFEGDSKYKLKIKNNFLHSYLDNPIKPNKNFIRETVSNYKFANSVCFIRFSVTNNSTVLAKNVVITFAVKSDEKFTVIYESNFPDKPISYNKDFMPYTHPVGHTIQQINELSIEEHKDRKVVTIECGNIQPNRSYTSSEPILFKLKNPIESEGFYNIEITLFGDNVSEPTSKTLVLKYKSEEVDSNWKKLLDSCS